MEQVLHSCRPGNLLPFLSHLEAGVDIIATVTFDSLSTPCDSTLASAGCEFVNSASIGFYVWGPSAPTYANLTSGLNMDSTGTEYCQSTSYFLNSNACIVYVTSSFAVPQT